MSDQMCFVLFFANNGDMGEETRRSAIGILM